LHPSSPRASLLGGPSPGPLPLHAHPRQPLPGSSGQVCDRCPAPQAREDLRILARDGGLP
jgi:hypothetical protein